MTLTHPPRLATWILTRVAGDTDPLVGDEPIRRDRERGRRDRRRRCSLLTRGRLTGSRATRLLVYRQPSGSTGSRATRKAAPHTVHATPIGARCFEAWATVPDAGLMTTLPTLVLTWWQTSHS